MLELELVAAVVLVGAVVETVAEVLVVESTSAVGVDDCPHPAISRSAAAPAQAAADDARAGYCWCGHCSVDPPGPAVGPEDDGGVPYA